MNRKPTYTPLGFPEDGARCIEPGCKALTPEEDPYGFFHCGDRSHKVSKGRRVRSRISAVTYQPPDEPGNGSGRGRDGRWDADGELTKPNYTPSADVRQCAGAAALRAHELGWLDGWMCGDLIDMLDAQ